MVYSLGVRKLWAATTTLVGLIATRSASADLPLVLDWQAPAACPDASFVIRRVEKIRHGAKRDVGTVIVHARIERRSPERFELVLTVRANGAEETRSVAASSCMALAEASAVVIALAIDASREAAAEITPPPPSAPEPVESKEPEAPPASAPPLRGDGASSQKPLREMRETQELTPAAPVSSRRFSFALGAFVSSGILPLPSAGVLGAGSLRIDRFRAGLVGTVSFRQRPIFGNTAGASFDMIGAGAYGAYLVSLGPLAIGPAAGLEANFVRVEGYGIKTPQASRAVWPTAVFGARAELRISRYLGLFALADLAFSLGAPRFTLLTSDEGNDVRLHEPALAAPRLGAGLEIVVP